MDRSELFVLLIITAALGISGIAEYRRDPRCATLMLAIPVIGWIVVLFGR